MELENIVANTVLLKAREGKWTREAELGGTRNFAGLSRVVLCCGEGNVVGMVGLHCSLQQVTQPLPSPRAYTHPQTQQLTVCARILLRCYGENEHTEREK